MPQARASNTSNMLTPISRHPAAHAACCLPPWWCCLLFVVACCLAMLPKSYCQALTATRQPTDSQTDSPRGQRRRGNIESNSIDVDAALWAEGGGRGNCGAAARAALFDNFFMQRFLLAFLFSLSLFSSLSLIFYLCCRYNAASFLSFPFLSGALRGEIKRITDKALRLFQ